MHRVLLALADGDLRSLRDVIRLAHSDHRDVLRWEEHPGAGKLVSRVAQAKLEEEFATHGMAVPKGLR